MARLLIKSDGFDNRVIELKLGTNRFGRSSKCDFQIEHSTVSTNHCEIILGADEVRVRDCDSTNGTFINGEPVHEAALSAGQTLHLGQVEIFVETDDAAVAIPRFEVPRPAPPVVLADGGLVCSRHPHARVTHRCTRCREVMCDACVHGLRRRGGKLLKLCPICSNKVEPLGGEKRKKKTFLEFLQKTVKLPFLHIPKSGED